MSQWGAPAVRTFGVVTSGFLLALAFPGPWSSTGWSFVSIPAVALFTLALRGIGSGRAALLSLLFGLVFTGISLSWLDVIGPDAWAALVLLSAVLMIPLGPIMARTAGLAGWPIFAAAGWVLVEAVRSRVPFGGFSWARLAFSTPGTPMARYAALGGAPLTTFAVALSGTLLAAAVIRVRAGARRNAAAAVGGVILVVSAGLIIPVPSAGQRGAGSATTTVALIQGDVAKPGIDFLGRPELVLTNHVRETVRLAGDVAAGRSPAPVFVAWPENASDLDPFAVASAASLIDTAVKSINRPVLVGAVLDDPADSAKVLNAGIVWDPKSGPGAQYAKQHLVPFGEYVPFRSLLSKRITRFDRVQRDFAPGHRAGVLDIAGVRIGDVICFEIAYDSIPAAAVRGGARLIVVQTNNATYGATAQPDQQLAISRLRAIEHGRTVVIASTSGITAIVNPDGAIAAIAPSFAPAYLVRTVALRDSFTLADRLGRAPELLLIITALLGVGESMRRRRLGCQQNSTERQETRKETRGVTGQ